MLCYQIAFVDNGQGIIESSLVNEDDNEAIGRMIQTYYKKWGSVLGNEDLSIQISQVFIPRGIKLEREVDEDD